MSAAATLSATPPPALTWLHLFPSDAKFCRHGLPDWLEQPLATFSDEHGSAVQVAYGSVDYVEPGQGIVAVNAPQSPDAKNQLTYIRRFAAIPNLRQTRWLIPLDTPAISSAAFSLYTPARLSARFKRWAVRLAIHTRLRLWYRDQLTITVPKPPPLEQSIAVLFPGRDVRLALSSGAPEGALNRKASGLVIDADGTLLAFMKLARSPIARRILANEAEILPKLAHLSAPRLLLNAEVDGTYVLVQTPLPGKPVPVALGAAHLEFLHSLQSRQKVLASETAMVCGLRDRLAPWTQLLGALEDALPLLRSLSVPLTVVHGDFAPWNLRVHHGRISAFDWEYAEIGGLPLIDRIHYALQVGMMLENWDASRARRFLGELAQSRALGLEPPHIRAICTVYVLDALARLLGEGYPDDHEMIVWHRALLDPKTLPQSASERGVAA